jgi:protein gp37
MAAAEWHTFQVLTKRATRMRSILATLPRDHVVRPHIWLGVSVEDRRHGLPRIPKLLGTPAAVRFLSIEPLLEELGGIDLAGIDWVIVGGESGPGARPMRDEWVRSLRDQCGQSEVPFFFKQWGGVQKSRFGRELDGRTHDDLPSRSSCGPPERSHRQNLIASLTI